MPTAKFFEHGKVSLISLDGSTRQAAIQIVIPCCLMQTITPALLGGGHIDKYELLNPVAVWAPTVGIDRFKPDIVNQYPDISNQASSIITKNLEGILKIFQELSTTVTDPSDFIPILPMGVYVKFRLRCEIDKMAQVLINLENTLVAGVPEFRFALAEILAAMLHDV